MSLTRAPGKSSRALHLQTLTTRLQTRQAKVGVIGLGPLGLRCAIEKAKAGFQVLGIDRDAGRVESLQWGLNYCQEVADRDVAELVGQGALEAERDFSRVSALDVVVLAVPAMQATAEPGAAWDLVAVAADLAAHLRPGQLICVETPTPPGTTDDVLRPLLEAHGLRVERDFFLAHTGTALGGVGPASSAAAGSFHAGSAVARLAVGSSQAAELAGGFAQAVQQINQALADELAMLCDRLAIDVWELIDTGCAMPAGLGPYRPASREGSAPLALLNDSRLLAMAAEVSGRMPAFVRARALHVLNRLGLAASQASILVVGPDDGLEKLLSADGAAVRGGVPRDAYTLAAHDLVILTATGPDLDLAWVVSHARHVLDACHATRGVAADRNRITRL